MVNNGFLWEIVPATFNESGNLSRKRGFNYIVIENTSKELKTATCGNNIRYHLRKISDFKQVENQLFQVVEAIYIPLE